jgi:hypothetical protein
MFATKIAITTNGDGRPEVAIAQAFPREGTKVLVYIFEVVTNETGMIANQALQQVASVTLDSPSEFNVGSGAVNVGLRRWIESINVGQRGYIMASLTLDSCEPLQVPDKAAGSHEARRLQGSGAWAVWRQGRSTARETAAAAIR